CNGQRGMAEPEASDCRHPKRGEDYPAYAAAIVAMPRADGRLRTNQSETIALSAAALIPPHPAPVSRLAANMCQGAREVAQATRPTAIMNEQARVTFCAPNRW